MSTETTTVRPTVRSRWWYVVAFILVWSIVSTALFAAYLLDFEIAGIVIVPLAYLALAALFLHPVALYFDSTAVRRSAGTWQPNTTLYVLGAVAGLVVPFLNTVLAAVYLYRRHVHVGVP